MRRVLDSRFVDALVELDDGDGAFLSDIVALFAEEATAAASTMVMAAAAGDLDAVREHAHRLAGSAGMVGAFDVARLCLLVEEAIVRGEVRPRRLADLVRAIGTQAAFAVESLRAVAQAAAR